MSWILTNEAAINLSRADTIIFGEKKITVYFQEMHQVISFETEEHFQQYRDYIESLLSEQN
jgi:hypothetical protein